MSTLGGVILAAGMSSRMGAFKPLLPVGGITMIDRTVAMMRRAGARPVVVTGYQHEILSAHLQGRGLLLAYNPHYKESQMLDSLLLGLDALENSCRRVLISPADVPLVKAETVERILALEGQFVRPTFQGEPGHPVLLARELIPVLRAYRGEGGLRGAIESSGVDFVELPVADRGVVLDSDTPEDYETLQHWHRRQTEQNRGRER